MHFNLIMGKRQTKPNWGTFYEIIGLDNLKSQCHERKKQTEENSRLKENKETRHLNAMCDSGLDSRQDY